MMKKFSALLLALVLLVCSACGSPAAEITVAPFETVSFTDSCDRTVEIPVPASRIAASGPLAQMILATLAPEALVGVSGNLSESQLEYLPEELADLPVIGQLYGGTVAMNLETILDLAPQLIIDLGDRKADHAQDITEIQEQTGIPTIFIEASGETLPAAYRTLGKILGKEEQAEELAVYIEQTFATAAENRAKLDPEQVLTVLFTTGSAGLDCNAAGSVQAQNIELVGGVNVLVSETVSNKNGANSIDFEELYILDPDVILFTDDGPYETVAEDSLWNAAQAVQNGSYYEIPGEPYGWMSSPPSVNQVLGIYWLGAVLYPDLYDYDMADKVMEYYRLFWHRELTREDAEAFLANSTGKLAE